MSKPQVVIIRKDKRIRHKLLHATVFALTGGVSGIATAAEAANHASYNARTRRLQAEAEGQPARASRQRGPTRAERRAAQQRSVQQAAFHADRQEAHGQQDPERPVTTGQ